jgi:hypothetical protein
MRYRLRLTAIAFALCATAIFSTAVLAQPFGAWLVSSSSSSTKYVEVPSSSDLNPITAITIEAWVSNSALSAGDCRSLVGKDFTTSYWLGICGNTFRSYLAGSASVRDGGIVPNGQWTHVAVTYDGTNRRHYINGELISTFAQTGSLPASTAALRIASDVSWMQSPNGAINEVRLWNVARTVDQIRGSINTPITAAQPGLVAVWSDGLHDALGAHNGNNVGGVGFLTFPVALGCTPSPTALCLSGRFSVTVQWRDFAGNSGVGTVVPGASADSGLFWFFAPAAWEVLAKTVNGCALNNRWWAFGAATTNVFYRLEFLDVRGGASKIYFNYPGVASPAVTDAAAFGTCP